MVFTFVLTPRVVLLDTYFRNGLNRNAKKSRRVMTEMKIHRTAISMKILTLQELSMPGTLILISSFVKLAFISFTSFFLSFFFFGNQMVYLHCPSFERAASRDRKDFISCSVP